MNERTDGRTDELINEEITLPAVYPGSVLIRSFFQMKSKPPDIPTCFKTFYTIMQIQ